MTEKERQALEAARQSLRKPTEDDVAGQMSERGKAWLAWKGQHQ